jgi:hypothetical protein
LSENDIRRHQETIGNSEVRFDEQRSRPETEARHRAVIQTRETNMLTPLLNLIYREFLKASLAEVKVARQAA